MAAKLEHKKEPDKECGTSPAFLGRPSSPSNEWRDKSRSPWASERSAKGCGANPLIPRFGRNSARSGGETALRSERRPLEQGGGPYLRTQVRPNITSPGRSAAYRAAALISSTRERSAGVSRTLSQTTLTLNGRTSDFSEIFCRPSWFMNSNTCP